MRHEVGLKILMWHGTELNFRPASPLSTRVSRRKTSAGRESRPTRLGRWSLVRGRTFRRMAIVGSTMLWRGAGSSTRSSGSSSWWLPPGLPAFMMMLQESRPVRLYNWRIPGEPCQQAVQGIRRRKESLYIIRYRPASTLEGILPTRTPTLSPSRWPMPSARASYHSKSSPHFLLYINSM